MNNAQNDIRTTPTQTYSPWDGIERDTYVTVCIIARDDNGDPIDYDACTRIRGTYRGHAFGDRYFIMTMDAPDEAVAEDIHPGWLNEGPNFDEVVSEYTGLYIILDDVWTVSTDH